MRQLHRTQSPKSPTEDDEKPTSSRLSRGQLHHPKIRISSVLLPWVIVFVLTNNCASTIINPSLEGNHPLKRNCNWIHQVLFTESSLSSSCNFSHPANTITRKELPPRGLSFYILRRCLGSPRHEKWKNRRRNIGDDRHQIEDDEIYFDSNGLPIHLHDDVSENNDESPEVQVITTDSSVSEPPRQWDPSAVIPNVSEYNHIMIDKKNEPEVPPNSNLSTHREKSFNNTSYDRSDSVSAENDTIFDDILRGFSFAFFFCLCLVFLYRACWYICVRCGIVMDDRVVEARMRRFQLQNKRTYFDLHSPPPLDTRSLGRWFIARDNMRPDVYLPAGVWDDDAGRSVGNWDEISEGAIDFDVEDQIQLVTWNEVDGPTAAALEYGEGFELEDECHDERLFDVEDRGEGLNQEANKFFERHRSHNIKTMKARNEKNKEHCNSDISQNAIRHDKYTRQDASLFNILEPPSNPINLSTHYIATNAHSDPSFVEKEFPKSNADSVNDDNDIGISGDFTDEMGYDEESDLLGLRSDSPPPLDLEEIEKSLQENADKDNVS